MLLGKKKVLILSHNSTAVMNVRDGGSILSIYRILLFCTSLYATLLATIVANAFLYIYI